MPDMKLFVLFALLSTTLCAPIFVGCGGKGGTAPTLDADRLNPQQIVGELDSLKMPPDVDPRTWELIVSAFVEAVNNPKKPSADPGDALKVGQLGLEIQPDASANLSWLYVNKGDYDSNGEVNTADITPIAIYFLANELSPNWDKAQVADGDGNGEVNLADVTPIAVNYRKTVTGYQVQESSSEEGAAWDNFAFVPLKDGAVIKGSPVPAFSPNLDNLTNTYFYRVVPVIDNDETLQSNAQSTSSQYLPNVWAMEGGNAQSQSSSPLPGPDGLALQWSLEFGRIYPYYQPVVGSDGTVYVVTEGSQITSVNPDGELKWVTDVGFANSAPVLTPDGKLLVANNPGITVLNPDGEILESNWLPDYDPNPIPDYKEGQILVDEKGEIYIRDARNISVFLPDRELDYEITDQPRISQMAVNQGQVYCLFAGSERSLKGFSEDGSEKWNVQLEYSEYYSIGIHPDGSILVHHVYFNRLYQPGRAVSAFNPDDGALVWSYESELTYIGMAICQDGTIMLESQSGEIANLDANGNPIWVTYLIQGGLRVSGSSTLTQHCVDVNGQLFVMANRREHETGRDINDLFSISVDGNKNWNHLIDDTYMGAVSAPVIGLDKTLFFIDSNNTLHAVGPEGTLPPQPPSGVIASNGVYTDHVEIAWEPVQGADGYKIYHEGFEYSIGHTTDTTWIDRSLETNPSTYYVTAINEVGESLPSEAVQGSFAAISGDSGSGAWSMPNGNAANTNQANVVGLALPGSLGSFDGGIYSINGVVFGSERTVYVSSQNKILAVKDGQQVWEFDALFRHPYSLSIDKDGRLLFFLELFSSSSGSELYCMGSDRSLEWKRTIGNQHSDLVIGEDGTVYFTEKPATLTAVNPDGELKWSYQSETVHVVPAAPSIGPDGTVYFKSGKFLTEERGISQGPGPGPGPSGPKFRTVFAVNPDGSLKWSYPTIEMDHVPIVVSPTGTLFITGRYSGLLALDTQGNLLWESDLDFLMGSMPAVGAQGQLFIKAREAIGDEWAMWSLNPDDGSVLWQFSDLDSYFGLHIVDGEGTIFVTRPGSFEIQSIDKFGQEMWKHPAGIDPDTKFGSIFALGNSGNLYFSNNRGKLYWLGEN